MSRRWRYPRSRRGDFYPVIPTTAPPAAPSYTPVFQEPSGRNSRARTTRRGRFWTTVSTVVVQASTYIPSVTEPAGRNSRPRVVRRGEFYTVPLYISPPVSYARTRRPSCSVLRRGRFYAVPPVVVAAGPSPLPPSFQRPTTRRLVIPRRGEYLSIPKVGQAPAAPTPPPPTFTRPRVRLGVTRRGEYWTPVPQQVVQIAVWVPQFTRADRAPVISVRRGRYSVVLPARATCPARIKSRRTAVPMRRHGQMWMPSWVYVPPVVIPQFNGTSTATVTGLVSVTGISELHAASTVTASASDAGATGLTAGPSVSERDSSTPGVSDG